MKGGDSAHRFLICYTISVQIFYIQTTAFISLSTLRPQMQFEVLWELKLSD